MKSDLSRHGRRLARALSASVRHGARARPVRHAARWGYYLAAAALVLLAIFYTAGRLLFPQLEARKAEIEQYLSARTAHAVRIEKLEAYWDGLLPGVHLEGVNVAPTADSRPAVRLAEVHATFSLLPLAWGEIKISRLVLTRPSLTLERLADGRLRVVGLEPVGVDEPGADEKFIKWLLRQRQLTIREGEIAWVDRRDGVERMQLSDVEFDLRNRGERHKAGLRARAPEAVCRECSIALDIDGNPFGGNAWGGEVYLRAVGLDVDALPRIARERLPATLRGRFDAELWSEWDDGMPERLRGDVGVAALQVPLRGLAKPVRVADARGSVDWRRAGDGWKLDVTPLILGLRGAPWAAGRLRLARDGDDYRLRASHVELADLSDFVADLQGEHALLQRWARLRPGGALDQLDIQIDGPLSSPQGYRVRADLARVTVEPHDAIPGVRGLSGRLDLGRNAGEFHIDTHEIALDLPRVFRAPLQGSRIAGNVSWEREADGWRVRGEDLTVLAADGTADGEMQLVLPDDHTRSPHLTVRANLVNGNGGNAAKYYPAHRLPPKILAWMDAAFLGGTITRAQLVFDGAVRDFPFDGGTGRFEVRGHVRDGVYRYLKGWAPVTQAEVDVTVIGRDVLVTGGGRIGDLAVEQVAVQTRPATDGAKRHIAVTGKVRGPVAESLRVLREVAVDAEPPPFWHGYVPPLQASGDGVMSLDVDIPLGRSGPAFTGEYEIEGARLALASPALAVYALNGRVRFSNRGVDAAKLRGRSLGGAVALDAARTASGALSVTGHGRVLASELARLHGEALAKRVSGHSDWQLHWQQRAGLGDLRLELALDELRLDLPPPFDRVDRPAAERLLVRTQQAGARLQHVDIDAGALVRGKLVWENQRGWRLTRGQIGFNAGRVVAPTRPGLYVSANFDRLDVDQWLPLLGGGTGAPPPALLREVRVDIKQIESFDRNWGRLRLGLAPVGGGWRAQLEGDSAAGRARYVPASAGTPTAIALDLARLRLPEKKHPGTDSPIDPKRLPAIHLRTASFEYQARDIGAVDFSAAPYDQGWRIARLNVTRPEGRFTSRGTWRVVGNRHASAFDVELSTSDMGETLAALGAAGQVSGGKVDVRTQLAWAGSPTNPRLAALDGRLEFAAEKGRFLQLDPGAARLFGLLDLRAITRYLVLDFSSAFGKGLAFDKMHGTVTIERGNAYTSDLFVKGPSVGLTVEGRVGLAAEDFDLVLAINPKFSDTLTLTSWGLFGPQAAAAILAIQKIFKKQIAAGTRVTYLVKGAWDNPTVTKVDKPDGGGGADEPAAEQ